MFIANVQQKLLSFTISAKIAFVPTFQGVPTSVSSVPTFVPTLLTKTCQIRPFITKKEKYATHKKANKNPPERPFYRASGGFPTNRGGCN